MAAVLIAVVLYTVLLGPRCLELEALSILVKIASLELFVYAALVLAWYAKGVNCKEVGCMQERQDNFSFDTLAVQCCTEDTPMMQELTQSTATSPSGSSSSSSASVASDDSEDGVLPTFVKSPTRAKAQTKLAMQQRRHSQPCGIFPISAHAAEKAADHVEETNAFKAAVNQRVSEQLIHMLVKQHVTRAKTRCGSFEESCTNTSREEVKQVARTFQEAIADTTMLLEQYLTSSVPSRRRHSDPVVFADFDSLLCNQHSCLRDF